MRFNNVSKENILFLESEGFTQIPVSTYYELICFNGPCTVVLFRSGTLILQGSKKSVQYCASLLSTRGVTNALFTQEETIIGSDEALKGDTFGGLVVAAVRADEILREHFRILGVTDSKKIAPEKIFPLATIIKKIAPHSVISLTPEEYNKKPGNVTQLLNTLHTKVLEELSIPGAIQIVDEFPGCTVGHHEPYAESTYIEVAAASILARSEALHQFERLSELLNYPVPKGSTHVEKALLFLKKTRMDPSLFVKMHFKNVHLIFSV